MELKPPTKKGYKTPKFHSPLPICSDGSSNIYTNEYDWPYYTGKYNGTSVIIDDPVQIIALSNKGFFGKGSLSKGCPSITKRKAPINFICESQWKRRNNWQKTLVTLLQANDFSHLEHSENSDSKRTCESKDNEKDALSLDQKCFELEKKNTEEEDASAIMVDLTSDDQNSNDEPLKKKVCSDIKSPVEKEKNLQEELVPKDNSYNNDSIKTDEKSTNQELPSKDVSSSKTMEVDEIKSCSSNQLDKGKEIVSADSSKIEDERHTLLDKMDSKSNSKSDSLKQIAKTTQEIEVSDLKKTSGKLTTINDQLLEENEVLVIADLESNLAVIDVKNLNPHIEKENIKTVIEVLYLTLEEAFFLSYALDCLQVIDLTSTFLTFKDMWILFQKSQPDFIEKYVAYHYFRSKGWVVKSGIKFGSDFLLYKKGPLYYHASYVVIIQLLSPDGSKLKKGNSITWDKISAINRMSETANKEILICQIVKPDLPSEQFLDPSVLKEFSVGEYLVRRWQPTQEKDGSEKII